MKPIILDPNLNVLIKTAFMAALFPVTPNWKQPARSLLEQGGELLCMDTAGCATAAQRSSRPSARTPMISKLLSATGRMN